LQTKILIFKNNNQQKIKFLKIKEPHIHQSKNPNI
jgi:hypothetical protein